MQRPLTLAILSLALTACVDTTGLSGESSRTVHPQSNPNAPVVVAEFADLQCSSCRAAHTVIMKPLLEEYGSRISYEFHHFPIMSLHRYALDAAEAAECAADQGKFWEFVDLIYSEQDKMSKAMFEEWGKKLGLDMELFNRCRSSRIKRDGIIGEYEAGKQLGIGGTPTFFVNGEQVESTLAAIKEAIDAAAGNAAMKL